MRFTAVKSDTGPEEQDQNAASHEDASLRRGRFLLLVGALGAVTFVVLVLIGGAVTDGYSHLSQAISELGATGAEHAGLQAAAFVVVGVGVCCYAAGLHLVGRVPPLVTVLVLIFGVLSSFAQAALPCDEGCKPTTGTGTGHVITGATGFVAVLIAMFVLARHWSRSEPHGALGRATRGLAWGGLAGLVAFNVTRAAEFESVDGLAQRAFVLCVITWIVVTAIALRQLSGGANGTVLRTGPTHGPSQS